MSDLYTDDDVAAGMQAEFLLWESKHGYMPGVEESVPAILAAVAPAITARALRELAHDLGVTRIPVNDGGSSYIDLHARADEIEGIAKGETWPEEYDNQGNLKEAK